MQQPAIALISEKKQYKKWENGRMALLYLQRKDTVSLIMLVFDMYKKAHLNDTPSYVYDLKYN